jgi:hypothetical protein
MRAALDHPRVGNSPTHLVGASSPTRHRPALHLTEPEPWRRSVVGLVGLLAGLGIAVLVICWIGASHEAAWRDQLPWVVGAALGTGLVPAAAGLWMLVGFREVRRGFVTLAEERSRFLALVDPDGTIAAGEGWATNTDWVRAAGMTRVHRPDCLLMRGKAPIQVSPLDAHRAGSCGVCADE